MSNEPVPVRLDLEQQKKRAKELLKAQRAGDAEAARRFARHLPRLERARPEDVLAARLTLSEAQLVVAREAGFASWPRLKHALEARDQSVDERTSALIEAAVRGDAARVRALLELEPGAPRRSLHAACAVADADAALEQLRKHPAHAKEPGGPLGWTPLVTLTCAALAGPHDAARRVEIARALLASGADATETVRDSRLIQGDRTVLSGAVCFARSPELLEVLLAAGGARTPRLWNTAIVEHAARLEDPRCLELLLPLKPPSWELRGALATAVERHDAHQVRMLLDAGADPNASGVWGRVGGSLHHAILAGCGTEILEALRAKGAKLDLEDRDGRTPLRVARRVGHDAAVALLAKDSPDDPPGEGERLIAAALAGEDVAAPAGGVAFERSDHQTLAWALRTGRATALPRLLAIGLDPDVPDDDGRLPLGLAAGTGDAASVGALLAAGADVDRRDLDGRTALEHVLEVGEADARAAVVAALLDAGADAGRVRALPGDGGDLSDDLRRRGAVERTDLPELFERAADAVVEGELDVLRALLADEPGLVHARSPRDHRATLLHYVGANGVEDHRQKTPPNAPAILAALLEAGAEPDALALTYGGGPAQTTMGLLVSSSHPADAGVQAELVRLLVRGGANPDGLDRDGLPLATAIAFRCAQAVEGLVESARLDNAVFAAAAGRLDLLEREVGPDGRLVAGAGHCRVPWLHVPRDPVGGAQRALIAAAQLGHLECVRWLTGRGVDPGAAGPGGVTAIHEAAFAGHVEVVRLLLDLGVDPNVRERLFRSTAIGWATEGKRDAVLALLLERTEPDLFDAIDLNRVDLVRRHLDRDPALVDAPQGRGALLRWAALQGWPEMVRLLLERGARRGLRDDQGKTPLDHAREKGHEEVVSLLERDV